jgi:osmotically inducible lipoprotein OsmB
MIVSTTWSRTPAKNRFPIFRILLRAMSRTRRGEFTQRRESLPSPCGNFWAGRAFKAAVNTEDQTMKTSILTGLAIVALGLGACSTVEQRVGGAAVGAGTGAVVAGPVGAVVGGAAGAVTAPAVVRTTRRATR